MGRQKFIDGFRPTKRYQPDPHQNTFLFEESRLFGELSNNSPLLDKKIINHTDGNDESDPSAQREDGGSEPQVAVGVFEPPFYLEDTEVTMPLPKQMSVSRSLPMRIINKIIFHIGNLSIVSMTILALVILIFTYVYNNQQFIIQLLTHR